MALIQADRVRETSSTTGSAGFTLVGAVDGFQRFSAAIGSANTCYYAATDGSAFEVGLGTVSANVLARTTVLDSSHVSSGVLHRVDFQAGTKDIFATYAADKAVILDADGNLTVGTTANITTLGNVSVAKTLTITSGISGASTLNIKGAVSAGSTLGVKGNVSSEGTLSVIGAVSVGATLGITNDVSVTGTFTFATANSTGNLGVVGNASIGGTLLVDGNSFTFNTASTSGTLTVGDNFSAKSTSRFGGAATFDDSVSVGGTFHIQGNASAQGTLNVKGAVSVSSTLGVEGEINNEVGNIIIDPTTKIVEIKGGGSTDGQIQLNCRSNSHGQKIMSQPHSEAITNEMLLPKGANSTLVSEAGTATITNKTLDVIPSISVTGTLKVGTTIESLSTVSDVDGNLRAVPQSRYLTTAGKHTATTTDVGNFIHLFSSDQTLLIGSAGVSNFVAGDIFTVVSHGQSANSTTTYSAAQVLAFVAGAETSTALITIANNGVSSVLFTSAGGCIITGNVS
tara:strand:+ start:394 stop:1929 length:1536 start_codon:yes stop_codon:yes gene_type:complete